MNNPYLAAAARRRNLFPSSGLVSYWKADVDGSFPDAFGGNDGTVEGATYLANGKLSGAYSFDGGDGITVGDIDIVNEITVSAWIYPTEHVDWAKVFIKTWATNVDPYSIFELTTYSTGTYFNVTNASNSSQRASTGGQPLGTWTHLVGTYDGSNIKLYVDGVLKDTTAQTGLIKTNDQDVYIGYNHFYVPQSFKGRIDEVGLWNKALTQSEITNLYNSGDGLTYGADGPVNEPFGGNVDLPTDLVSYWKLDGNPVDEAGINNGTVIGATSTDSGKIDKAYIFDGNDGIGVGELNIGTSITVAAWVYPTTLVAHGKVFYKAWAGGVDPYSVVVMTATTDNTYFAISNSSGVGVNSQLGSALTLNTWTHLVGTYDGSNVRFYVNGHLEDTNAQTGTLKVNTEDYYIGMNNLYVPQSFIGRIDEVGVWEKALTQTEITALYNSGNGLTY